MRFLSIKPSVRTAIRIAFAGTLAVSVVGCYWLRYYDLLETHVSLMQGMANDTAEAVQAGVYRPQALESERLRYPLLRARQFKAISEDWDGIEASRDAFGRFVDSYAVFVDTIDRVRFDGVNSREKHQIVKTVSAVNEAAASVEDCVMCERDEDAARCERCAQNPLADLSTTM
jgi:hypothetical protein